MSRNICKVCIKQSNMRSGINVPRNNGRGPQGMKRNLLAKRCVERTPIDGFDRFGGAKVETRMKRA